MARIEGSEVSREKMKTREKSKGEISTLTQDRIIYESSEGYSVGCVSK